MKVDVLGSQVRQAVFQAVKRGNVEFVTEMIKSIPELAWNRDINGRNIFFIAIFNRQEKIFNLLHGLTDAQKMKVISPLDRFGNSMLHLVAMLAPSEQLDGISGAALQMQRELQWFKEVKNIVPPVFKDIINSDGKKASEVFSQQHADLVKEGEKWMKEIATSSSFVAALIVTIMFAAAFTIPGAFCAALAILLKKSSTKVVMIPIILLACVPVTLFVLLQFPFLLIFSFPPGIFDRNVQRLY
ncbi:hypothetical protein AAG906_018603 [Vitis piasezkii]